MVVGMPQRVKLVAWGILGTFAVYGGTLAAQVVRNHNSNAPVDVAADRIELQDRTDRVVLSGNVSVTQAGLNIRSTRMTVAYSGGGDMEIDRIDAAGGVTITKEDLRATSNAAIYDLDSRLITLLGDVRLTQDSNRLNGNRLVIDLGTGRSAIGGGGSSSTEGGRVTGRFTVPQREGN